MPTTDPALLPVVLDALAASAVRFAVLHGEERLAGGSVTSDADVVADVGPDGVLDALAERLASHGLRPIAVWHYDVDAASIFFATDEGAGAQLDALSDAAGVGRYGVRAPLMLQTATAGSRWPKVASLDEALYLVRKRTMKGQAAELADAVARVRAVDRDTVERRIDELFVTDAAARVRAAIHGGPSAPERRLPHWAQPTQARRVVRRLRNPTGFWAALPNGDAEAAEKLVSTVGRVLPHRRVVTSVGLLGWVREVLPVRMRAGLVVSVGQWPKGVKPDLVLDGHDDLRRTVRAMGARL